MNRKKEKFMPPVTEKSVTFLIRSMKNRIINIDHQLQRTSDMRLVIESTKTNAGTRKPGMNPKTIQYLMGHSDIGVIRNTYTHLGLEDAVDELKRVEELENAREKIDRQHPAILK